VFKQLGDLRAMIPTGINIKSLTATATTKTRNEICLRLGMNNPVVVQLSPDKPHIFQSCSEFHSIAASFGPLAQQLKEQRTNMGKVIIFCKKLVCAVYFIHTFCTCYVMTSQSLQVLILM
jgi:superfamily II DNA helicase RecQ